MTKYFWSRAALATLALCLSIPVSAEQTATLPSGRKVLLKDDGTYRLLDEPKAVPAGTFTDVAILDLKVDLKDLVGKLVRVNASGSYTGEHLILSDPNSTFDTNGVFAKLDKLPRETRKWIVANCSDDPCAITIEGEVKKDIGILAPGIAASNAIYK